MRKVMSVFNTPVWWVATLFYYYVRYLLRMREMKYHIRKIIMSQCTYRTYRVAQNGTVFLVRLNVIKY